MDSEEIKIRKYENALSLLFYEGQIAWQLNIVFIALNVGLASFLSDPKKCEFNKFNGGLLIYSILGLIINFLWLGTFQRNNKYYNFRVAQAREIESIGWKFLNDRGYKFSKGKKIAITGLGIRKKDVNHQLKGFENLVSNKNAIKTVIILFISAYCILIILSFHLIEVTNI
jgi:hypothetical protein